MLSLSDTDINFVLCTQSFLRYKLALAVYICSRLRLLLIKLAILSDITEVEFVGRLASNILAADIDI